MYCDNCKKEVIIVGEGSIAGMDDELEEWEENVKKKGKLILYDPKPSSSYFCPKCGSELTEKN